MVYLTLEGDKYFKIKGTKWTIKNNEKYVCRGNVSSQDFCITLTYTNSFLYTIIIYIIFIK